jgi:hypothetical protein
VSTLDSLKLIAPVAVRFREAVNTGSSIAPLMPDCMADRVLLKGSRLALRGTMLPTAMDWLAIRVCWMVRAAVRKKQQQQR